MGWASAGSIFDPVAQALIDSEVPDDKQTTILTVLIKALQGGDWDTEGESLGEFAGHPAVVAAFRARGVVIQCGDETDDRWCENERDHKDDHRDWQGETWPLAVPTPGR